MVGCGGQGVVEEVVGEVDLVVVGRGADAVLVDPDLRQGVALHVQVAPRQRLKVLPGGGRERAMPVGRQRARVNPVPRAEDRAQAVHMTAEVSFEVCLHPVVGVCVPLEALLVGGRLPQPLEPR